VALFYQKARDFERRAPVFNRRLEAWQADGQQLQAAIDSFNQQVQALRERTQRFNRDVQHYNSELQRARRMVDEINSMPPGPARDRKIREFRQLEGWLASESRRLDSESGAIDAEDRRLTRESAVLDQRIRAWKTEETWLNQEHASLTQLQQQIDGHSSTAEELLTEIERAVP
jgi:chromosome segregation ATPase